ncbi:MAG: anthranilate synthase component I family protein [Solirubrobacteraceae bacterium]
MSAASGVDPGSLRIEPSLAQLSSRWSPEDAAAQPAHAAAGGPSPNLIPLCHSYVEDCETPVSAFLKLRELARGQPCFLLESAEQGTRVGRWSFIGIRPRAVLRWSLGDGGDPYALAAATVGAVEQAPVSSPALAGVPFTGGAVGFFGYDLVRTVEPLGPPRQDTLGLPDMALMLTDALVIFDHLKHTVSILANADVGEGDLEGAFGAAAERIAEIKAAMAGAIPHGAQSGEDRPLRRASGAADRGAADRGTAVAAGPRQMPRFESNMSRERFEAIVSRIVEYVYAGDAFQVVPSQRWSAQVGIQAFSIYRGLRAVNPSPYMYFLDFGDFEIAGASPEPLLTVSGRTVSTRPIAGTRPRGADAAEDERIAAELLENPKERAEHVMLVDLGRNDLGRVCQAGSVKVDTMMSVEIYSHVMHIVSSVSGTLSEGVSAMDALRSVLPAGTLSGAPKVRAMQIIDELEPVKRGGYGGAIGYLSYGGDLDTCIHIRTVVVKDGVASIQAGGGTVAEAKPAYEYEESVAKSRAVLRAIELALSQEDWA